MKRYLTRAAEVVDHESGWSAHTAMTVFEPDTPPQWTGLYDAAGAKVYSVEEREPVGFVLVRA